METLTHIRNPGSFPPVAYYPLFKREKPEGWAKAFVAGNTYKIDCNNLKSVTLYIDPYLINTNDEISVLVNDKELYKEKVKLNPLLMMQEYRRNFDPEAIYIQKIHLPIP